MKSVGTILRFGLMCLLAGGAMSGTVLAQPECVVEDTDGDGYVRLPPEGCEYISPDQFHEIIVDVPSGTKIIVDPIHWAFVCDPPENCQQQGGSQLGEIEEFGSELVLEMTGTGNLAGWTRTITMNVDTETHTGPRSTAGDTVQTITAEMERVEGYLDGDSDFEELRITGGTAFGLASPGMTTLTDQGNGTFKVDSHFDVNYQIEFVGAPTGALAGYAGANVGAVQMVAYCEHDNTCPPVVEPEPDPLVVNKEADGSVRLPPRGSGYLSQFQFVHEIIGNGGSKLLISPIHWQFICDPPEKCMQSAPGGGGKEEFSSELVLQIKGTGEYAGYERTVTMNVDCETETGPRPGGQVQTFTTDMKRLEGEITGDDDFQLLRFTAGEDFGLSSPGVTTLTEQSDDTVLVDSTFDINYKVEVEGTTSGILAGYSGSNNGSVEMKAYCAEEGTCPVPVPVEPPPDPCVAKPDPTTGVVRLPPKGCKYLSPNEVHRIIDGLPAGTTIEIDPIHWQFLCDPPSKCEQAGGSLGGSKEEFSSELVLKLTGTGQLEGFSRVVEIPLVQCETHTARPPGDPMPAFPTEMYRLEGEITGDDDFDRITITAGTDFNLPSPGHTDLIDLGDGTFEVQSFFDIEYKIDFEGAEGGQLSGYSGETQDMVTVEAVCAENGTCPVQ